MTNWSGKSIVEIYEKSGKIYGKVVRFLMLNTKDLCKIAREKIQINQFLD
jgi:hypothetical protein